MSTSAFDLPSDFMTKTVPVPKCTNPECTEETTSEGLCDGCRREFAYAVFGKSEGMYCAVDDCVRLRVPTERFCEKHLAIFAKCLGLRLTVLDKVAKCRHEVCVESIYHQCMLPAISYGLCYFHGGKYICKLCNKECGDDMLCGDHFKEQEDEAKDLLEERFVKAEEEGKALSCYLGELRNVSCCRTECETRAVFDKPVNRTWYCEKHAAPGHYARPSILRTYEDGKLVAEISYGTGLWKESEVVVPSKESEVVVPTKYPVEGEPFPMIKELHGSPSKDADSFGRTVHQEMTFKKRVLICCSSNECIRAEVKLVSANERYPFWNCDGLEQDHKPPSGALTKIPCCDPGCARVYSRYISPSEKVVSWDCSKTDGSGGKHSA